MSEFRKVFISGPGEVAPVAQEIKQKLEAAGLQVELMPFDPQPLEPARLSLRELAQCQAVILLMNSKYGTERAEIGNRSITELEFDETLKRRLPIFCFIGKDASHREPRLTQLIEKVSRAAQEGRSDFTYGEIDFSDPLAAAQNIFHRFDNFRWTPKEFSSFGEWEVFLANQHASIASAQANPDELPAPIGRGGQRKELIETLFSSEQNGVLISGLPAHGKSLFLYHAIRELIDTARIGYPDIHVILAGQPVSIESVRQIVPDPKSDRPLLIIIDDADERRDLPPLLKMLANSPHFARMKLILVVQQGEEENIYRLGHPFTNREHFPLLPLAKLSFDELKDYSRIHGLPLAEPAIRAIHGITNGIPLYVDLYFHHGYDPRTISTAADMQDHFRNYVLRQIRNSGHEAQLAAAKALALIGGSPASNEELKTAFSALEVPGNLPSLLEELRAQHIVYLVGHKYKFQNRIVQDFILTEYWAKKPDSDRLLTLILGLDDRAKPILENIARAEWVIRHSSVTPPTSPFEDIWAALKLKFDKSDDVAERTKLLKLVGDVAYYLPKIGTDLLRLTHARYASNLMTEEPDQKEEMEAAAQIAFALALVSKDDDALFGECIDRLWDFGKYDDRPLNACPSHAHRRLGDLTEFRPGRRIKQYQVVLAHAELWLVEGREHPSPRRHGPLEVLKKLLDREWEQTYTRANVITIQRGALPHTPELETLKLDVIKLIGRCVRGEFDPQSVPEAIHLLRSQLPIYQPKEWGRLGDAAIEELTRSTETFLKNNQPEFAYSLIHVLNDLIDVFKEEGKHPGIAVIRKTRDILDENLRIASPERHALLHGLLGRQFTGPGSTEIRKAQEILITAGLPRARELLEAVHNGLNKAEITLYTMQFAHHGPDEPAWRDLSLQLARAILEETTNRELLWNAPQFIWACRLAVPKSMMYQKSYLEFVEFFNKKVLALNTEPGIKKDLEDSYQKLIWILMKEHAEIELLPQETALIARWKQSPDHVWGFIVGKLAEGDVATAKAILLSATIDGDNTLAARVCGTLVNSKQLLAAFDEDDWEKLLSALVPVSKIEDHWTEQAVVRCSNIYPLKVADFFEHRIHHYEGLGADTKDYRPFPYLVEAHFQGAFHEATAAARAKLLNKAIDFVREKDPGSAVSWCYAEYANLISSQLTLDAADVLKQRIASGDVRELQAVAYVIQHSYPDFALDHADIVDAILTGAQKISPLELANVEGCLSAGAHTRGFSRQIGQPAQEQIQLKERAIKLKRQFLPGTPTYKFYSDLEKSAQWDLDREAAHDAEILDE